MSAIDNQPSSYNFLSPINFAFRIKKAPNINFFVQQVILPGIELPAAMSDNPFTVIPHPGDHVSFGDLTVVFKVNDDLSDYLEIYNWMRELGFPQNYTEYSAIERRPKYLGTGIVSDVSVLISDSKNIPKFECTLINAWPTQLSGFTLNTTAADVDFVTCTAVFKYTYFTFSSSV